MRIIQQSIPLPVIDVDTLVKKYPAEKPIIQRHGHLFPKTVRCLVTGPSNSGKTNSILSLIYDENGLSFSNLYIYSKSLFQPKYQMLGEVLGAIPEIGFFPYSDTDNLISVHDAKSHSLIIFDDIGISKQSKISEFFSHGRHKFLDCIYSAQCYSNVPRQIIRNNCNLLLLFRQDELNLKHVFQEHVDGDMSFNTFKHICERAWKNPFGFLTICRDSEIDKGRFRIGFDQYILI